MTTTDRQLGAGLYGYEDVRVGDQYTTPALPITAQLIDAFAELSGDHFEIHMDRDAAQDHGFTDRVAHGLLILSVVDGLKNQAEVQFKAQASLGWNWTFSAPVLIGDIIKSNIRVLDISAPKSRKRAIISLGFSVTNQHGKVVQEGHNKLMVYK